MDKLIEKLSAYNIFNYLLPGTLFAFFAKYITDYKIIQSDVLIALFLYYFIGLLISRVGSLIIEPSMRKLRFVKFAPYADYVAASSVDPKIDILSEANNVYRTLCALFLCLGLLKIYEKLAVKVHIGIKLEAYIAFASLFILFAIAYCKQTAFVVKRIEAQSHEHR